VEAVDTAAKNTDEEVFGQIGNATYLPHNFKTSQFMGQAEFDEHFKAARIVIAHAGMGTILTAMREEKTLIVMARKAELSEHRNDHQRGTVKQMSELPGIYAVESAEDIQAILARDDLETMSQAASPARERLIQALRKEFFTS
jgi:UDP-N-acetylglucosamine transferase subunit ALG13